MHQLCRISSRRYLAMKPHPKSSKRFEEWLDKVTMHLDQEEDPVIEGNIEKALKKDKDQEKDDLQKKVFVAEGVYYVDQKNLREQFEKRKNSTDFQLEKTNFQKPISFGFDSLLKDQNLNNLELSKFSPLERLMIQNMKSNGPMSVRDFMKMALTDPHHGYYTTKQNVFGKTGDFITSPEISPVFGEVNLIILKSKFF
jgi:hypothetical protein